MYEITSNYQLKCRELLDETGAVVDSADFEDAGACMQLRIRCDTLNAIASAHEAQALEEARREMRPVCPVTREAVGAALMDAAQGVKNDTDLLWFMAMERAIQELEYTPWMFDGSRLVIASRNTAGKRYHVDAAGCECLFFGRERPCWHIAMHRLLTRAAQISQKEAAELFV